jgi:hypothetical protein
MARRELRPENRGVANLTQDGAPYTTRREHRKARALLSVEPPAAEAQKGPDITPDAPPVLPCPCPHCGGRMIVIEVFARGCEPKWRPAPSRIDTS